MKILITVLVTLFIQVVLIFVIVTVEPLKRKFKAWIDRKLVIKEEREKDLTLLEKIKELLISINRIRAFPDPLKDKLEIIVAKTFPQIITTARKIKSIEFSDLKNRFVNYSERGEKINPNALYKDAIKLLLENKSSEDLAKEIKGILDRELKQEE